MNIILDSLPIPAGFTNVSTVASPPAISISITTHKARATDGHKYTIATAFHHGRKIYADSSMGARSAAGRCAINIFGPHARIKLRTVSQNKWTATLE